MNTSMIVWRVLKFVGLALFGAGLWGAVSAQQGRDRLNSALWMTTFGLMATWMSGYGLMKLTDRSFALWIFLTMGLSMLAATGGLVSALWPRLGALGGAVALGGLGGSIVTMVVREALTMPMLAVSLVVFGGLGSWIGGRFQIEQDPDEAKKAVLGWFTWMARVEGLSLILMICISMPIRLIFDVRLDGGTGWIGWVHGALFVSYLQALAATAFLFRWPILQVVLAFVGSLLPAGTFLFERRYLRDSSKV